MAKDVELFKAAMADVKPLKGQKPAKKAVTPKPKVEGPLESKERPLAAPGVTKELAPQSFDRDVDRAKSRVKLLNCAHLWDVHRHWNEF